MILTKKQEEGLKIAVSRFKNNEPYTCIAGYGGTGKSFLVKFIIEKLNLLENEVCYIAYTGKATEVLRNKGCHNAITAHRLLFDAKKQGNSYIFIPKKRLPDYKVIVVDEISMLPKDMWNLLLSHKIHVIALGDPGQLPPVSGEKIEILKKPHIFLDEIVRQALDNEIIRLSFDIRQGKEIQTFIGKQVRVFEKKDFDPGMYFWADQILCAKNDTRRNINFNMHKAIFETDDINPVNGDKMLCFHNEWNVSNDQGEALINGSIGTIDYINYIKDIKIPFFKTVPIINFKPSEQNSGIFYGLKLDRNFYENGSPYVIENYNKYRLKQFDYGYAITVWKAQGSEWNNVLLINEINKNMTKEEYQQFLYTAATRAKEKLIIIK